MDRFTLNIYLLHMKGHKGQIRCRCSGFSREGRYILCARVKATKAKFRKEVNEPVLLSYEQMIPKNSINFGKDAYFMIIHRPALSWFLTSCPIIWRTTFTECVTQVFTVWLEGSTVLQFGYICWIILGKQMTFALMTCMLNKKKYRMF